MKFKILFIYLSFIAIKSAKCQEVILRNKLYISAKDSSLYSGWYSINFDNSDVTFKEFSIKNGLIDSLYYEYYNNGKIKIRREINRPLSLEHIFEYYKSGNISKNYVLLRDTIIYESNFYNDKYHSTKNTINFKNGKKHGKTIEYFPFKSWKETMEKFYQAVSSETNYFNGKRDGNAYFYYKNGNIRAIVYYSMDIWIKTDVYKKNGKCSGQLVP